MRMCWPNYSCKISQLKLSVVSLVEVTTGGSCFHLVCHTQWSETSTVQHPLFKDRAFKMILTDLLYHIFWQKDLQWDLWAFQANVKSCYSPCAYIPLSKGRANYLNFSGLTTGKVIKSQQPNSGGEKSWADRHRSHTGLNSSRPVIQTINTAVTHHNFYPTLVIGYLFSMREIQFVKIPAFPVKNTCQIFCMSPLEGLITFWEHVGNAPPKWYVLCNSCNLFIIFIQLKNSKTSFK